jgi:hypothetical protein
MSAGLQLHAESFRSVLIEMVFCPSGQCQINQYAAETGELHGILYRQPHTWQYARQRFQKSPIRRPHNPSFWPNA